MLMLDRTVRTLTCCCFKISNYCLCYHGNSLC